jgi:hypothetical protein
LKYKGNYQAYMIWVLMNGASTDDKRRLNSSLPYNVGNNRSNTATKIVKLPQYGEEAKCGIMARANYMVRWWMKC